MATTPPCGGKAPLLTALLASALFALPACPHPGQGGPDAGGRVLPVTVIPASVRDVPVYLDGLGSVTAYNTVTVKTQVDGRLDQVFFKEGQPVKKGEVLAQIDPRPFIAQLHQAEGALARDQSLLVSAQLDLTRYEKLVDQKLIPSQQFDQQKALVGQDQGLVQVDQAAVESARLNVGYARITSPVDGITGIRIVDPGNVVHAADQGGIILVTQLDPIAVIFTLPEDDLPRVSEAKKGGPLTVEAYNRGGDTRLGTGELGLIDNQINQTTATMRLKAILPNPDHQLWPNQFVKARLLLATRKDALVIPTPAVQRGPQGIFVYVVGPEQTAVVRQIEIDSTTDELTLVRKGLQDGDLVVVEGQNMLRPGAKVAPHPPSQNAGASAVKGMP
jgi:multidrug efflux system membrane fusion protein